MAEMSDQGMNEARAERILAILRASNTPRGAGELRAAAEMNGEDFDAAIEALAASAQIARSKKGKYALPEKLGLISGRAHFLHSGAAVLRPLSGGEEWRIEPGRLMPMPDDLLICRATGENRCAIEQVCARARDTLCAYTRIERDKKSRRGARFERVRASAVPCDPRIPYAVSLEGDLSFVRNNEIALLRIDAYPERDRPIVAHAERILGGAGSMLARMRATAEEGGFPTEFPEEAEAEAIELRRGFAPAAGEKREDLRDMLIFTIDGASSKDFDDAVSISPLPDGGRRLGVHIADVSHYVRPGSAIDREARARGTSLYLPGCTVPMLPEALSNEICSLMPDADRMALSLFVDLDADGRAIDHRLCRSLIRSKARLTYAGVNRYFDGAEEIGGDALSAALDDMRALARTLRERRHARGAIDFDLPEPEFVLNEKCEPEEILCPQRGEAERLIEEFMLLANETVARLAKDTQLPFLYRIHEAPDPDKLRQLETNLSLAGAPARLGEHPHPGMIQKILEESADSDAADLIRRYALRALKRAQYAAQPLGHYALSMADYCHFTSPIRRYPDLTVHRMLKLLMDGELGRAARWEARMPELARETSQREQASVQAERAADDIMKAAYMARQIGRKFDGVVSGVAAWGVYVTLQNSVEGLIHISDLDGFYTYDAERQQLSSDTGPLFRLGMKLRVRVERANIERGEVNFALCAPRRDG